MHVLSHQIECLIPRPLHVNIRPLQRLRYSCRQKCKSCKASKPQKGNVEAEKETYLIPKKEEDTYSYIVIIDIKHPLLVIFSSLHWITQNCLRKSKHLGQIQIICYSFHYSYIIKEKQIYTYTWKIIKDEGHTGSNKFNLNWFSYNSLLLPLHILSYIQYSTPYDFLRGEKPYNFRPLIERIQFFNSHYLAPNIIISHKWQLVRWLKWPLVLKSHSPFIY